MHLLQGVTYHAGTLSSQVRQPNQVPETAASGDLAWWAGVLHTRCLFCSQKLAQRSQQHVETATVLGGYDLLILATA